MQTKQRDTISQLNLHSVHVFLAVHVFPHTVLLLLRYTEVHINNHYLECLDFKGSHQHCRNKHEYVYNVGRIIIIVIDIHLFFIPPAFTLFGLCRTSFQYLQNNSC